MHVHTFTCPLALVPLCTCACMYTHRDTHTHVPVRIFPLLMNKNARYPKPYFFRYTYVFHFICFSIKLCFYCTFGFLI